MPSDRPRPTPAIERARRVFQASGGLLRAREARMAGVHSRTLSELVRTGEAERLGRGLYRLADARAASTSNHDLALVAKRSPTAVICLVSALAFHELTTQIPGRVDIALPPGARSPKFNHPPIRVHRFTGLALTAGVEDQRVDGVHVRVYSPAKTVADCFKFRNKIGLDIAVEALRLYCRRRGASIDALVRFAEIDRVKKVLAPYLEATL